MGTGIGRMLVFFVPSIEGIVLLHDWNYQHIVHFLFLPSHRPNLQMTASSGSDFKRTVITPMPQQYTELRELGGSGTWRWINEGKPREAAAHGSNLSTSLPIFYQDSSSRSSRNFPLRSRFPRRSHPPLSSQSFPCLPLGEVPTQSSTDSSSASDNLHLGLVSICLTPQEFPQVSSEFWRSRCGWT